MKRFITALTVALLVPSPALASDEDDLRHAFQKYVRAFAEGDVRTDIFVPSGEVFFLKPQPGNEPDGIAARTFAEILPRWMTSKYPGAKGEIRTLRIVSPTMAYVEARLDLGDDDHNDLLVFYKLDGRWRVVAKATEAAQ